jgi:hypothetical protein
MSRQDNKSGPRGSPDFLAENPQREDLEEKAGTVPPVRDTLASGPAAYTRQQAPASSKGESLHHDAMIDLPPLFSLARLTACVGYATAIGFVGAVVSYAVLLGLMAVAVTVLIAVGIQALM